MFDTYKQVSVI
uniref:Uncharacterized protein n=1 Tax=Rhizophora mucronata TaxID=61149 RepID=A0A2P2KV65_RHIMU